MKKYDIAAYVWPSYTGKENRSRIFWEEGIGEWQSVRKAHEENPARGLPLWGFEEEADPAVMEKQIDAAVAHGVNVFIYDWYWYDGRPFLENCLDDGFLKAKNRSKMKFYIMWANHDAGMVWDRRNPVSDAIVWRGSVDRPNFETVVHRIIDNYFSQPEYYKIDGKPVFMVYDVENLIKGLGGVENTVEAIGFFREETVKAGFPGLELQMTFWNPYAVNLSGVDSGHSGSAFDAVKLLGFDSITHYQFIHFTYLPHDKSYPDVIDRLRDEWKMIDDNVAVPYYPHVSIGWDNNPRFPNGTLPIMTDSSPEAFEKGLRLAREYSDSHNACPLITVNSWNEWTESSYLEPDTVFGYGYLEAIRRVFCEE